MVVETWETLHEKVKQLSGVAQGQKFRGYESCLRRTCRPGKKMRDSSRIALDEVAVLMPGTDFYIGKSHFKSATV